MIQAGVSYVRIARKNNIPKIGTKQLKIFEFDKTEQEILFLKYGHPRITVKEIFNKTGISESTITQILKSQKIKRVLEQFDETLSQFKFL
jgi:DNA-directed RNA polymerase specialized sigma subunit